MSTLPAEKLREAYGRLNAGDLAGAERLCAEVLRKAPRHPDALHLLGVVRLAGGSPAEAVTLIGRALEASPGNAPMLEHLGLAHLALNNPERAESAFREAFSRGASHGPLYMRLGLAQASQGKLSDAIATLREAARRSPEMPDVHLNLGNALAERGDAEEALAAYGRVLALQPGHPAAHFNIGTLHSKTSRPEQAIEAFQKALASAPDDPDIHNNLGLVYERQRRLEEAAACFRRALSVSPGHVHAWNNLGSVLRAGNRTDEAAASFEKALAIRPDFVDALINLGSLRAAQSRPEEAQALYERALRVDAANADALRSLGALLKAQGRLADAIACYRKARQSDPGQPALHVELGHALRDGGDFAAASDSYRKAIELDPGSPTVHFQLAETCKALGRFDEAASAYARALELKPAYVRALGGLTYVRQHMCDWDGLDAQWARLRSEAIGQPDSGISPFSVLYMPFSAAEHLACAKEWARQELGAAVAGAAPRKPAASAGHRVRIGYLSWDFHQHATSYLVAELFELHDRSRYEIHAYSYGPDDGSPIRARIRGACEHFVDLAQASNSEAADRIRGDGIDILVDLKGYTMGARPQILAHRPAPVQVNWLGFPGSMGTAHADYIFADAFIIPPGAEAYYAEKVLRLPDCYQVNDRKRAIADRTPTREECGLPLTGFVFCSFNQTAKILPEVFGAWMRILESVPGSVLWLLETNPWATGNLRREARKRGLHDDRLIFARPLPLPEHLARYRLAGLSLDTFPYGSHTTASDALWAGCPLLTRTGETFASRVAGSILASAGMRELVTGDLESYERMAVALASNADRLEALRLRLRENRDTCPLFDTPRFTRNLENAYDALLATQQDAVSHQGNRP
jgi:protein O-GlcNAc transferase